MRRLVLAALFASVAAVALVAQSGINNIMNLRGKVAADGALAVTPSANGTIPSQATDVIGNLRGKVDSNGNLVVTLIGNSTTATPNIVCLDGANQDVCLQRNASGVGMLTAGTAGTTFTGLCFGTCLVSNPRIRVSSSNFLFRLGDDSGYTSITSAEQTPDNATITVGSGTGITVNSSGLVRDTIYKVTIASTAFICAAVTCDVTIGTLPAKTWLRMVLADLTTQFACAAVCTSSTLSAVLGRGAGGAEFLASFDADAAAAQFGDADAELGTQNVRAAAIQGGVLGSWASTTTVVMRLTSGTGNIGTGAATNLSQGSVTFYLQTSRWP